MLFGIWALTGAILTFMRLMHPAYGIQGDLPLHYHITRSFARSFAEGEWLPRWAGLLDGGRGDAMFTFYPPFSYLLSAGLMKLFRIDVLTSLKLVSWLTLIGAQASAYLLARQFFERRRAVLVSVAYVLLPAYPLVALHRGFFANALALSLAPLALLGAHLLLTGRRRAYGLAVFTLSLSATILTHAITTYLCGVAVGLMSLIYLLIRRADWRGVIRLAGAGTIVLALTAFFLWPQRVERDWVQVGLQIVQQDYRNYFLFAKASDSSRYRQAWADVNFFISLVTLAQTITAILLGLLCLRILKPLKDQAAGIKSEAAVVWFGLALTAFGLLISLPASDLLWRYLPGLKFIQFPWRFQPFVALGVGLLAAAAWEGRKLLKPRPRTMIAAVLTWAIIANVIFTVMIARLDEPGVTRAQVAGLLDAPGVGPVSIEEGRRLQNEDDLKYAPYAANQLYFRPPGSDFNLYPPADQPGGLSFLDGGGRIVTQELTIARRSFNVECERPAQARLDTYAYPHWVARLDQREIKTSTEPGSGLILVNLPSGRHQLTLDFEIRERSERIARLVSLLAWVVFAGWIIFKGQRSVRKQ